MRNNPLYRVVPATALLLLGVGPLTAHAGWPLNGAPVCTEPGDHTTPQAVGDGQGGIIMVWEDTRSGEPDIYVQRLDGYGNELWTAGGVQISSQNAQEGQPQLASDGTGGAIIAWRHTVSDWDIRAQRVDAAGNVLWQDNGISICGLIGGQQKPRVIPDGAGGAVIVWEDVRLGNWDLYAQRVDASGARLWTPDGANVCTQTSDQFEPRMALDATGGVFFVWEDTRNTFQRDIYLQHFTAGGFPHLTTDGVPVCANGANQRSPQVVSLDIGGVVAVWQDDRTGLVTPTTFAQRVYASGTMAWTADGIQVCTFGAAESGAQLVNDNDHGVVVCWQDNRALGDVYAQRLDALGTRLWAATGVSLTGSGQQFNPHMTGDGNGGAIVSWKDTRYSPDGDIYAGRIDATGTPQGAVGGRAVTALQGLRVEAPIVSDGAGGAIMAWADLRSLSWHVYAQRLERFGNWGYPSAEIVSVKDVPGDQGGKVNVAWNASRLDPWPAQTIDRYTVWRSIDAALAAMLLKSGASPRLSAGAITSGVTNGIRVETSSSGTAYWQLVGTVDAYHLASYAFAAPTLFDSTATSAGLHTFQVIAHHDLGNEYWISNSASGRSIDDLAPAAPLMLTAQRTGSDVLLRWNASGENENDFSAYAIYRASSAGVQPLPGLFVTNSIDTLITDINPPTGFLYYIVTARDTHGNQSAPSNEAAVTIPTGIGERAPSITRLTLEANFPNPFSSSTDLRVGLPSASDVRVEVYDVAGRRVTARHTQRLGAGWQSIPFDGRDDRGVRLPSGVYFYRVTAAGETQTHKMVIGR